MRWPRVFVQYFVAILFIVSGFVKLVDPTGTAIKLEEYLVVFADQFFSWLSFFERHTMFLSIFLSSAEIVLGVALLIRFKLKKVLWLFLGIIIFFTALTFYSAYTGEVTDCGCFGDAMPLTPWQSFTKDLVLLVCILFLLWQRDNFGKKIASGKEKAIMALSILSCLFFASYNLDHLPVIDFRQYKVGTDIREKMNDGKPGVYQYTYEKDGKQETFDNFPTEAGWSYVDMKTVSEPTMPTISDFILFDVYGDNVTEQVLKGQVALIVSKNVTAIRKGATERVTQFVKENQERGFKIYFLTGSSKEKTEVYLKNAELNIPVLQMDETVIKAMIRANPGLMIFSDGIIKAKYNYRDFPTPEEVDELY